jgi:hypothetical protein
MSARRKSRSPPRAYEPQPPPPGHSTVTLGGEQLPQPGRNGSQLTSAGGGLDGTSRRSPGSPPHSPKSRNGARPVSPDASALAAYLAVSTAPGSGEPLLDDQFFNLLASHFRNSTAQQTQALRSHLNVNLPIVLGAMNCVNVVEPPGLLRATL